MRPRSMGSEHQVAAHDRFAQDVLGVIPDDWQADMLMAIAEKPRVAASRWSGKGIQPHNFPRGRFPTMSPGFDSRH
jgi:hypothetical protein